MRYTDRVLAYVTRERDGRKELLVFDHRDQPDAGTQVPAGRLEPDEDVEAGLLRELEEEAGLANARVLRKFGTFAPHELPHGRRYTNHAFEVEAPDAPDAWEHVVGGDGDDAGLVFLYRWVPLEPDAAALGRLRPGARATYELERLRLDLHRDGLGLGELDAIPSRSVPCTSAISSTCRISSMISSSPASASTRVE